MNFSVKHKVACDSWFLSYLYTYGPVLFERQSFEDPIFGTNVGTRIIRRQSNAK